MLNKRLAISILLFITSNCQLTSCMELENGDFPHLVHEALLDALSNSQYLENFDMWHQSLFFGILDNNIDTVQGLLKQAQQHFNIAQFQRWLNNINEELGHTALTLAVKNQYASMVRALIEMGANPLLKNRNGDNALSLAMKMVTKSRTQDACKILDILHQKLKASKETEKEFRPVYSKRISQILEEEMPNKWDLDFFALKNSKSHKKPEFISSLRIMKNSLNP